jgi:hypothetical protein
MDHWSKSSPAATILANPYSPIFIHHRPSEAAHQRSPSETIARVLGWALYMDEESNYRINRQKLPREGPKRSNGSLSLRSGPHGIPRRETQAQGAAHSFEQPQLAGNARTYFDSYLWHSSLTS